MHSMPLAQLHEHLEAGPLDLLAHRDDLSKSGRHLGRRHSSQTCRRGHWPVHSLHWEGDRYVELKAPTAYYGIIHSLFQHMWGQKEMDDTLEAGENFEIVASTIQCISTKLAVNVQRSTT